ncbi:hypothetical protein [[Flexibacter] sp. ATCC 35208]|uniref:hypothetical protein n=1 Tax=[Flexibacter] sp. ATCC 35208 TaxID=1936242 RepID=UPI0009D36029|nr:hypothetical protein [[Flexibacter] sp. ATCC 35208]OMP79206.1 hypothetical protein BW716_11385 [[Flexibacter] sp. ATCC 35208]
MNTVSKDNLKPDHQYPNYNSVNTVSKDNLKPDHQYPNYNSMNTVSKDNPNQPPIFSQPLE